MISDAHTRLSADSDFSVLLTSSSLSDVVKVAVVVVSDSFANESDSLGRHLRRTDCCEGSDAFVLSTRTSSVVAELMMT